VRGAPLTWIRGTNPFETRPDTSRLALKPRSRDARYVDAGRLGYEVLERLGYTVDVRCEAPARTAGENAALMLFSRHDNAWYLSGYAAAPVGFVKLKFPEGAPVFHTTHTRIEDGAAHYPLARAMHHTCRVFVQQESGIVGCHPGARDEHHRELTLRVSGLQDAAVVFLPPAGMAVTFEHAGGEVRFDPGEARVTASGLSGDLVIRW
jgi:hypothetical protein